ncbi:AI-2E family transporter [Botrimarina hoheduenensis]|uniref:Putative inner membrane protein n=1 Tax=Botrimarina hoheduenensis TaxID=2528000 RepID=A0A5C5VWF7_9BACT|nr:AI-2E family transporter [Botrimarina hoheduenensis]TWT42710.1 putative inner membrane protein [Botrimarina hoheduenensis]
MASEPSQEQPPTPSQVAPPDRDAEQDAATVASAPTPLAGGLPVQGIPRVISLIVLLAVVLLISVLFFRVMASFVVPLFLAAVLAVVFKPLQQWSLRITGGRPHRSALITTLVVSLGVLVPTLVLGWRAYVETSRIVRTVLQDDVELIESLGDDGVSLGELSPLLLDRPSNRVETSANESLPAESAPSEPSGSAAATSPDAPAVEPTDLATTAKEDADPPVMGWIDRLRAYANAPLRWYHDNVDKTFDPNATLRAVARYSAQQAVSLGLVGIQALVSTAIGLVVMIFALYYFFADGPKIIETLMHLSPLDDEYEHELLVKFASVSRAVVVATLLSAVVQGLLAGIGYQFALDAGSPVFLLTVLTMLLAIVPFVGATAVWIPVALWVFFVQEDTVAAVVLAVYGAGIVSTIDNVIKPLVLHGQSNLHPLLALLSILGGIQLLGPVGILVGPMLVAFMQALLGMLRRELDSFNATPPSETA